MDMTCMRTLICSGLLVVLALISVSDGYHVCRHQELSSHNFAYLRQTVAGAVHVTSITVIRQKSKSPCIPKVTFGTSGPDVFVDQGCRALFNICYEPGVTKEVRCESHHFKQAKCYAGGAIRFLSLKKANSRSPCVEGFSYFRHGSYIVVNKGCRATFLVGF